MRLFRLLTPNTPTAKWVLGICTVLSGALIVAGFLVPPIGVIDGSVLKAVGEMFAFGALWVVAHALFENGADIRVKHGDTDIEIDTKENDNLKN